MGAGLVGVAAVRFARLPGNEYKALIHMCLTALDKPNNKPSKLWPDGHPAALWYANWEDLALAIGRDIPKDTKLRHHLRRDIRALCRALEAAGAIEARPHPKNDAMKAYHLLLEPCETWVEKTHQARARRGSNRPTPRGSNYPTDDAKAWVELPPLRGVVRPPRSRGEEEEDLNEDLAEDASPPARDQPSVDTHLSAARSDLLDGRAQFKALRRKHEPAAPPDAPASQPVAKPDTPDEPPELDPHLAAEEYDDLDQAQHLDLLTQAEPPEDEPPEDEPPPDLDDLVYADAEHHRGQTP